MPSQSNLTPSCSEFSVTAATHGLARSNWRSSPLPRSTAASSASCAVFLRRKRLLRFFLDDIADQDERSQAQSLGVFRRRLQRDLFDRYGHAGIAIVEALVARQIVGGAGDRHGSRCSGAGGLDLGARRIESEETRHALAYSSRGRSFKTHRVAPPMIEFCGAPGISGQYGSMPLTRRRIWNWQGCPRGSPTIQERFRIRRAETAARRWCPGRCNRTPWSSATRPVARYGEPSAGY